MVTGTCFNNAIRRSTFFLRFFVQHFMHIHRGRTYRADGNGADCLTALSLFAVDRVSGKGAKGENGKDAQCSYKYTLITENINTLLIVVHVNNYKETSFL